MQVMCNCARTGHVSLCVHTHVRMCTHARHCAHHHVVDTGRTQCDVWLPRVCRCQSNKPSHQSAVARSPHAGRPRQASWQPRSPQQALGWMSLLTECLPLVLPDPPPVPTTESSPAWPQLAGWLAAFSLVIFSRVAAFTCRPERAPGSSRSKLATKGALAEQLPLILCLDVGSEAFGAQQLALEGSCLRGESPQRISGTWLFVRLAASPFSQQPRFPWPDFKEPAEENRLLCNSCHPRGAPQVALPAPDVGIAGHALRGLESRHLGTRLWAWPAPEPSVRTSRQPEHKPQRG